MNYKTISFLIILLFTIPSISLCLIPGNISPSVFAGYLYILVIVYLLLIRKPYTYNIVNVISFFSIWLLINIIRGFFLIESRLDWIIIISYYIIFLFVLLSVYLSQNLILVRNLFQYFIIIGVPSSIILYLHPQFYSQNDFVHYLSPIYLLILSFPYLKNKYRIIVALVAIISLTYNFDIRSNVINILAAVTLNLLYLFKLNKVKINKIRVLILLFPFVFLILGVGGIFNVFKIGDYIGNDSSDNNSMYVDSRSFIYSDVLTALKKDDAIIWGLSSVGKYKTSIIKLTGTDYSKIYKNGRRFSEVGIMNIVSWGGSIAFILYFFIFYKASYLAINKSNNYLSKILGLWVSFKWLFSFFEDPLYFNMYSLFLFVSIGLCFNPNFRNMNDSQIISLFKPNIIRNQIKT